MHDNKRIAILPPGYPNMPRCADLARLAAAGERPRKDYVELARVLDADVDVIDSHYLAERASPLARVIARRVDVPAGQIAEAFVRREQYHHICAWSDRQGLPLALLYKLARSRRDLVLLSVYLSHPKKAIFLRPLKAYTHLRAIVNYGSVQMEIAASRLGVPRDKLYLALQPVDDRFWRPVTGPPEQVICAAGWERRDYSTLIRAVRGMELEVEIAAGYAVGPLRRSADAQLREWISAGLPPNVSVRRELTAKELRSLYARSRFVVVPLQDVEFDAGVTALTEAMAMGKAVIVTRTRGQVDLIREGEQGIYVPPGDPSALRAAIEYLNTHPEQAERMGRAGRMLAEQRHALDAWVAQLAAILQGGEALADGGLRTSGAARTRLRATGNRPWHGRSVGKSQIRRDKPRSRLSRPLPVALSPG